MTRPLSPAEAVSALAMPAEVDGAREAVEQRGAVQEERRGERAEQEVLERRLLREQPTSTGQARQQVQRQREHLERDEHREQVGGCREEQHAADANRNSGHTSVWNQPSRVNSCSSSEPGQRRGARREGVARRVDLALGHDERRDEGEHQDRALHEQRRAVDGDRALAPRRHACRASMTTNAKAATSVANVSMSWIGRRLRCGRNASTRTDTTAPPRTISIGASAAYSIVGTSNVPVAARMALTAVPLLRPAPPAAPGRLRRPRPSRGRRPG